MILYLVLPVISALLWFCADCVLQRRSGQSRKLASPVRPLTAAAMQILLFTAIWLVQRFCMTGYGFDLPWLAWSIFCLVTGGAYALDPRIQDARWKRSARRIGILCTVLLVLEIVGFHANSFSQQHRQEMVSAEQMDIKDEKASFREANYLVVGNDSAVATQSDQALPEWTRCVTLQLEQQPDVKPLRVKLLMTDGNFLETPQIVGHKLTSTYRKDVHFCIIPYEELRGIRVEFFDVPAPTRLYSLTCWDAVPFSFSLLRWLVLFTVLALGILIREFRLYRVVYNHRNSSHRVVTGVMTILCVLSFTICWMPGEELISYPDGWNFEEASPYEQTLDAFESGHAWLNQTVSPELLEFDALFDRVQRDASKIPYLFDRALYEGKYYSYFGLTPVLTFYYPVYWLTGKLPTVAMTCMFYAPLTILLTCLALLAAVRMCCKKPNFLLLLLSMPTVVGLCGVFYTLQFPNQYDVAVASGLCSLMLALWSGMEACMAQKLWRRGFLFAVCGIGVVLCVQSRPSMAITALILAPFFVGVLRDRKQPVRSRILQAVSFGVPVAVGAALTMYYNAVRFSSPLDFGAGYQLTISNIQANVLRPSAIPAAVYHYLLQPPTARPYFPYFTLSYFALDNYHMYNNLEHTIGALSFPMTLLAAFLVPKALRSRRQMGGAATAIQSKAMVICALVMTVLVAWMDFCLGGVSLRYLFDFMPILLLGLLVVLLSMVSDPTRYLYRLALIAVGLTFVMLVLLMAELFNEGSANTTLVVCHPTVHELLEEAILFWG